MTLAPLEILSDASNDLVEIEDQGRRYRCRLQPSPRNRNIRISLVFERPAAASGVRAACLDEHTALLPGLEARPVFMVRVTFPPRLSRRRVLEALRRHLDWVEKQVRRFQNAPPAVGGQVLATGARLYVRGLPVVLYVFPQIHRRSRILHQEDKLFCYTCRTRSSDLKMLLEKWYRIQAEELIRRRLRDLAPAVTSKPFRIMVRTQRSRWGSCSESRTLSFNWKLAMMPDFVLDYVLIHELAHLEEMNHSVNFWRLVRRHCADADAAKHWLKQHGPELEW